MFSYVDANEFANHPIPGRHRCVGLGIAKLTIKTIVCLFVMTYDYDITRTKRKSNPTIPIPDHNKVNEVSVLEKCTAYRFIKILIRRHAQRVKWLLSITNVLNNLFQYKLDVVTRTVPHETWAQREDRKMLFMSTLLSYKCVLWACCWNKTRVPWRGDHLFWLRCIFEL